MDEIARLGEVLQANQEDLKKYADHVEELEAQIDSKDAQITEGAAKVEYLNEEINHIMQELQ